MRGNNAISYLDHVLSPRDGPEWLSRCSDFLRSGRSEDRIPFWGKIFRTCPDRPWGPPSLLYNGYRVFPGGNVLPGREADPSPLLVHRSKIEQSYTSTLPKGLRGLWKGETYVKYQPHYFPKVIPYDTANRVVLQIFIFQTGEVQPAEQAATHKWTNTQVRFREVLILSDTQWIIIQTNTAPFPKQKTPRPFRAACIRTVSSQRPLSPLLN